MQRLEYKLYIMQRGFFEMEERSTDRAVTSATLSFWSINFNFGSITWLSCAHLFYQSTVLSIVTLNRVIDVSIHSFTIPWRNVVVS